MCAQAEPNFSRRSRLASHLASLASKRYHPSNDRGRRERDTKPALRILSFLQPTWLTARRHTHRDRRSHPRRSTRRSLRRRLASSGSGRSGNYLEYDYDCSTNTVQPRYLPALRKGRRLCLAWLASRGRQLAREPEPEPGPASGCLSRTNSRHAPYSLPFPYSNI